MNFFNMSKKILTILFAANIVSQHLFEAIDFYCPRNRSKCKAISPNMFAKHHKTALLVSDHIVMTGRWYSSLEMIHFHYSCVLQNASIEFL